MSGRRPSNVLHSVSKEAHDALQQSKCDLSWERYYEGWPDIRDRYDVTVALIRGPAVLDIGCGQGLLLHLLGERRPEVTCRVGLDSWGDILYEANSRLAGAFELWLEEAEHLPGKDGEFDTVVLGQILEHVHDVQVTAREAVRVLKSGGRLIVNVPADDPAPHGSHVRVFRTVEEVMDLFWEEIDWSGWGRLHRFWYAWGEKR